MDNNLPDRKPPNPLLRAVFSLLLLSTVTSGTLLMGIVGYTGSMRPTFNGGEQVFLEPASSADIGDIIVFERGEKHIIHRVIFEFNGCYITKGDSVLLPDFGCADPKYKVVV